MGTTSDAFYSDRTRGPRPRDKEALTDEAWRGLDAVIWQKINGNWLAHQFPLTCSDGNGIYGTHKQSFFDLATALVPDLSLPLGDGPVPSNETAFDLVDFVAQRVAKPKQERWHDYYRHYELSFDEKAGRKNFRADINQVFARTGMAYELGSDMRVVRLGPVELRPVLSELRPDTGEAELDSLIEQAYERYVSRDPHDARIGIEKLWDAFERMKTIEAGVDKKAQTAALLDGVASGRMLDYLDSEARALTEIGNNLQIRHFETTTDPVDPEHIDYLFGRMTNFIVHVLRRTGRLST